MLSLGVLKMMRALQRTTKFSIHKAKLKQVPNGQQMLGLQHCTRVHTPHTCTHNTTTVNESQGAMDTAHTPTQHTHGAPQQTITKVLDAQ
jgi:hypothetical protein